MMVRRIGIACDAAQISALAWQPVLSPLAGEV